jgi:vomeronasal1 receptor
LFLFWVINMLVYIYVIEMALAKSNITLFGHGCSHAYCQSKHFGKHNLGTLMNVTLIRDLLFVAVITGTRLYIVCLLYRHLRRAQHIFSSSLS